MQDGQRRCLFWVGLLAAFVAAFLLTLVVTVVLILTPQPPRENITLPMIFDAFGEPKPLTRKSAEGACWHAREVTPEGCKPQGIYYFHEDSMGLAFLARCDTTAFEWPGAPRRSEEEIVYRPWGLETAMVALRRCEPLEFLPCHWTATVYLSGAERDRLYVVVIGGLAIEGRSGGHRILRWGPEGAVLTRIVTAWLLEEGGQPDSRAVVGERGLLAKFVPCGDGK